MSETIDGPRLVTRVTQRTARYALLGVSPERAQRIWFVLHGYGQLAPRFLNNFVGHVPANTCVVAPEALSRFYADMPRADGRHLQRVGATWMTREAREDDIADTLAWLELVARDVMQHVAPDAAVGVLGFSQGVATASRWVAEGTVRPAAFVAWAGRPAHDVRPERLAAVLANASVTFACGDTDEFLSAEQQREVVAQLAALQPSVSWARFHGGHHLNGPLLGTLLEMAAPSTDAAVDSPERHPTG
jgi:predicted esterase